MVVSAKTDNALQPKRRQRGQRIQLSVTCLVSAILLIWNLFLIFNRTDYKGRPLKETVREKLRKWRKKLRPGKPVTVESTLEVFDDFLHKFKERMASQKEGSTTYEQIWQVYHDLVAETLYPWDQHYLEHMPERREDDSIYVSIASYRDEHCLSTMQNAYSHAQYPEKLFVGLVQQNCVEDCKSGVLEGGVIEVRTDVARAWQVGSGVCRCRCYHCVVRGFVMLPR